MKRPRRDVARAAFAAASGGALVAAALTAVVTALASQPVSVAQPAAVATRPIVMPRPAPQLRRDTPSPHGIAARNAACESCHAEIAAEWRSSRHAAAYTNDAFQQALAREGPGAQPFCRGCHAPEALPELPPPAPLASVGVGCITCHVPLGPVLAAPAGVAPAALTDVAPVARADAPAPLAKPRARVPHGLSRVAAFGTEAACAPCHQFAFPRAAQGDLQRTVREHLAAASDTTCASCHMPWEGEGRAAHRSHRFPGGHDADFVRSALTVTAERSDGGDVRIALVPRRVTHAVPTGDLFRRLAVFVEARDAAGALADHDEAFLARHFRRTPGSDFLEVADDRPRGAGRTVGLSLARPAHLLPIAYRVVYQRVAHAAEGGRPSDAAVEGEIEIARGVLPPSP